MWFYVVMFEVFCRFFGLTKTPFGDYLEDFSGLLEGKS